MEDNGILCLHDEKHLHALHLVFKKKIQGHLDRLVETLMRRPLRSERSRTPLQLWIEGQVFDPIWQPQSQVCFFKHVNLIYSWHIN